MVPEHAPKGPTVRGRRKAHLAMADEKEEINPPAVTEVAAGSEAAEAAPSTGDSITFHNQQQQHISLPCDMSDLACNEQSLVYWWRVDKLLHGYQLTMLAMACWCTCVTSQGV